MTYSRRSILATTAGAMATGAIAGCLSEPDTGDDDQAVDGYAAFFTLYDWCREIAGETMTFETPVEVGEIGHGWEPPANLPGQVASADVFVYLDTPEYSWAQNLAADLERDAEDVQLIDAMGGLESVLLPAAEDPDDSAIPVAHDDVDVDPDTVQVGEFAIYDGRTDTELAYWHTNHWHGGLPDIPVGESAPIVGVVEDTDGTILPLGAELTLDATLADGAMEGIVDIESDGETITIEGIETGRTQLIFELSHDGEVLWETSDDILTAVVVEEATADEAPEFYDPHVWVDPIIAQEIVETIVDGLVEHDPANEDGIRENAAAYIDRLDDVHARFEAIATNASRDVAVFAGHDSFGYLEHRYDFELHTPVGIAPDAAETEGDIADMIALVEEHDIDTILYDPFETPNPDSDVPQMVELLLENTNATDYAPLTPAEGTTPAWNDNGWGWVEQMLEINIPSLEAALDVQ